MSASPTTPPTEPPPASGLILAGGSSRRMGRDKLGIAVGGKPLIQRSYDVLARRCEEVLVAISGPGVDPGLAAKLVRDFRPGKRGPLAGMEAGISAARNDRIFVAAGDMPLIPESLVASLLENLSDSGTRVAVPRYGGRLHPLCAAYRREVLTELSFTLNLGVSAVHEFLGSLEGVRHVEEELPVYGDPELYLMSVNSPEDLARARNSLNET